MAHFGGALWPESDLAACRFAAASLFVSLPPETLSDALAALPDEQQRLMISLAESIAVEVSP